MTVPSHRIEALASLAGVCQQCTDPRFVDIGYRLAGWCAGEFSSLDDALFGVTNSPRDDRNAIIKAMRNQHFKFVSDREAAKYLSAEIACYHEENWPEDRDLSVCPHESHTLKARLWEVLKLVPRPLSDRQIRKILGG